MLARGTGVLIVLDGCTQEADLRAFAANMSDVAKEAGRRGIRAPAVLQCVVTSNVKLEGPAGARLCVKLGRLTLAEKQAVCRRWMARFGKDRVSEQQVMKAVRKAHSHLPLYLVLFCSEASLHAVFESIDDALEGYPEELEELWARSTLRRLEDGSHRALVAYFMQHLLAAPQGMSLRHIRACAARQAHLRAALPVAEQSQMIDFIAVNLRTFIYARDSDHIFLRSETLRQCTMARYAPRAMRHSQVVTRLEQVAAQGEGVWTAARNSIVHQPAHVDSARRQATTAAAAYDGRAEWAMDWVFDAVHRNLQVKMEGRQVSCMRGEDVVTALVQPEAAKDRCSYFEVKIESCGQVNIKVGFLINPTEQHLRRVPDRQAASQQANGWLFNCRNGNLVNKSIGNEWLKLAQSPHEPHPCVAKGSAIGRHLRRVGRGLAVHVGSELARPPASPPASPLAHMPHCPHTCFASALAMVEGAGRGVRPAAGVRASSRRQGWCSPLTFSAPRVPSPSTLLSFAPWWWRPRRRWCVYVRASVRASVRVLSDWRYVRAAGGPSQGLRAFIRGPEEGADVHAAQRGGQDCAL